MIKINKLFSFFVVEFSKRSKKHILRVSNEFFTITQEILVGFCQSADRRGFKIYAMRQRERAENLTICYLKKNKFASVFHAFVQLSTVNLVISLSKYELSPRGSTATLTML